MIDRQILEELQNVLKEYPVVTILGPRQAGKTTLAKSFLTHYSYTNLEEPDVRLLAQNDPRSFLNSLRLPVIIDEIQRVPALLSYIQVLVDEKKENGQFILTGSHQLHLQEAITQSLAGRTAILKLLPLSIQELNHSQIEYSTFHEYCLNGFLPRVYDQKLRPSIMYSNYYQTYVERDVKLLVNIKDMALFEKFIKLLAGRVGQIMNHSSLANDVGIDSKTIKQWLSILEASFIIYKLNPYYENFGKRVIKSPKYYFIDTGLLCYILGIETKEQLERDPLVGNIFENLNVIEVLKSFLNHGKRDSLYFFRDSNGNEIDLIVEQKRKLIPIEFKSGATFQIEFNKHILNFQKLAKNAEPGFIVYSGNLEQSNPSYTLINFKKSFLSF